MAQFSELAGAAPLQPEPYVLAVESQHQTERERDPVDPHDGPQLPQAPFCQLTQFGLDHDVDSGAHPPQTDSAAPEPSE